jgi:hypothetical protein
MRDAAGSALPVARSIAQICFRVVIRLKTLVITRATVAELGKVRVNRTPEGHAFSGLRQIKSSARPR